MPSCAGFHQLFAFYSANQYYKDDTVELDQNVQSADTTTNLTVNNSTTVAGQAITFTGAQQRGSAHLKSFWLCAILWPPVSLSSQHRLLQAVGWRRRC